MKMSSLAQYLQERYPLQLTIPLGIFNALLLVGLLKLTTVLELSALIKSVVLISLCYFFMMLRQRCIDEFRDEEHDKKYFPFRPLPRGLVTKKQILFLGIIAFAGEVITAFILAGQYWWAYLPVIGYFFFIMKDFFINKKLLERHFTFNFLLHLPVYFLINLFFIVAIKPGFSNFQNTLLISFIVFCWQIWIEILRKYEPRLDSKNQPVKDSYLVVWGQGICLTLLIILLVLILAFTFLISPNYWLVISMIVLLIYQLLTYKKAKIFVIGSFGLAIVWAIICFAI